MASRLFAQPALPTTNQTVAPIANPYSASWIYYTTNPATGLGYLNGASIPYVMAVSNNVVAYVNAATNGFVTAGITNGLATTSFVLSQGYVTGSVTNGLANTNFVTSQGYVTSAITNGLANTTFVTSQGYVKTVWAGTSGGNIAPNSTDFLPPNNSTTPSGSANTYTSGLSGEPVAEGMTLTNLFVIAGFTTAGGVNLYDAYITVLTNGVATPLTANIFGSNTNQAARTFGNTTNGVTISAGTEIGIKIVVPNNPGGGTNFYNVPYSWSFEGQ